MWEGLMKLQNTGITGLKSYAGNANSIADSVLKILYDYNLADSLIENARKAAKNKDKGKGKSSRGGTKVTTTTVDMPKISNPEAYKRIGKTIKPLNGQIVVYFGQKKQQFVHSMA